MTLLEWLWFAHVIPDWLIQTGYQANFKSKGNFFNWALTSHCLTYTASFIPVLWFNNLSMWWLMLLFWSHMFIDRRWPVVWWIRNVGKTPVDEIPELAWLVIVVDQCFHFLILVIIVAISSLVK